MIILGIIITMEKIVINGLKCDFHIHSYYSKHREANGLTTNNTEENIPKLVSKLKEYGVEMAAITDHDVFSYSMYSRLVNEATDLKLILPGVEFSVAMKDGNGKEKQIHVIALFDNSNEEKIKKIEDVLGTTKPKYDALDNHAFSQRKLIEILDEIGLDVVMIAHQKKTMTTSQKPQKNDLNVLGDCEVNYLLFTEYFQALEFHDKKNELFNIKKQREYKENILRFITGSDCHDWDVYPNHDSGKKDSDGYKHTFLKCLPSFRGVSLALTENSRISLEQSFFSVSNKVIESIDLTIGEKMISIPMSKGINAIIGDNSIGKSLLVHKITGYYRKDHEKDTSSIDDKICLQYDKYLENNNVEIFTNINPNMIYEFDSQGEIRKKFALNKLKTTSFFEKKHKKNNMIDQTRIELEKFANEYINQLKQLKNIELLKKDLINSQIQIPERDLEAKVLKILIAETRDYDNKKNNISLEISKFNELISAINNVLNYLDEEEQIKISEFKNIIQGYLNKRIKRLSLINNKIDIINIINSVGNEFNDSRINTTDDKIIRQFANQKDNLSNIIKNYLLANQKECVFTKPHLDTPIEITTEKYVCGDLKIVTCSEVHTIDDKYLEDLFSSPLKKDKFIAQTFFSDDSLLNALLRQPPNNGWNEYTTRIIKKINEDIKESIKLNKINEDDYIDHSNGFNDKMYFEIISTDVNTEGIYIIDQPEDDISQIAIRDNLIKCLRKMGDNRQVILITHNPQFVVNLDVDNVIYLYKDDSGQLNYHSGALEYKDSTMDILKDVAETLDGGVMTIRKRWKKYEKTINDIFE